MKKLSVLSVVGLAAVTSLAFEFQLERDIPYYTPEELVREGSNAVVRCKLDITWPTGVTNFATVVNFHGGGLVHGSKHFANWRDRMDDPVAHVGANYRMMPAPDPRPGVYQGDATPEQCVHDAAAAVSWVLKNIARYGGDPKKVFVTGISGGGYLTAMVGMAPKWLGDFGFKTTDLAGIVPLTGQVTKHFNVRSIGFKDTEPTYAPKVDEWAPMFWTKEKAFPPSLFLTGGRHDNEMPCRVEENELLVISLRKCGIKNARFVETEGSHGGGVDPSQYYLRDFVMTEADSGGVARFGDGERVAFYGDSITHGGRYVADLQLFQSLRRPGRGTRLLNVGVSGDSAGGGNQRLDWDLLDRKPNRVFIMFGMNDVGRGNYETTAPDEKTAAARARSLANYEQNMRKLVASLAARKLKVVPMTPSPYDQYTTAAAAKNAVQCNDPGLASCAKIVRTLAGERNLGVVDLHANLTKIQQDHADVVFCRDRVHPAAEGHLFIMAQILAAMHEDSVVAQVSVEADTGKVWPRANKDKKPETKNAVVSAVQKRVDGGVAFTYAPKALPLPATKAYLEADKYYPLTDRFNNETFYVSGLAAGDWELCFDNVAVGTFSTEAFAKGVNVALLKTPNQLRAQAAATTLAAYLGVEGKLRTLAAQDFRLKRSKIDPKDFAAADENIKKFLADQEARKSPTLNYYRNVTKSYRELRTSRKELAEQSNDLFAQLDAIRPLVSRVTIRRK